MDSNETKVKGRRWVLPVVAVFTALLIGGGFWATRAPLPPYSFLKKYPVVEWRDSGASGLKVAILKGDADDVWRDAQAELSGNILFSSAGMTNMNGVVTKYNSAQTKDGLVKVSNDLSFTAGSSSLISGPELRPGYCAVAFTRPKSIFDKALEWIRGVFGTTPKPAPQQEEGIPEAMPSGTYRI